MNIPQKAGLAVLVLGCAVISPEDGLRILTILATLALASYLREARHAEQSITRVGR
jgi:hypothetical protein